MRLRDRNLILMTEPFGPKLTFRNPIFIWAFLSGGPSIRVKFSRSCAVYKSHWNPRTTLITRIIPAAWKLNVRIHIHCFYSHFRFQWMSGSSFVWWNSRFPNLEALDIFCCGPDVGGWHHRSCDIRLHKRPNLRLIATDHQIWLFEFFDKAFGIAFKETWVKLCLLWTFLSFKSFCLYLSKFSSLFSFDSWFTNL